MATAIIIIVQLQSPLPPPPQKTVSTALRVITKLLRDCEEQ